MNEITKEQTTNIDDFVKKYITTRMDLIPEYKSKLIEVDKYTDGLGSYVVKLTYDFCEEFGNKKYQNSFGDSWLKHWKADYDSKDIIYIEEDGSFEFKFYNKHHSCLCPYGGMFIINRMVTEIRDYLLPVSKHLGSTLGRDSYAYKQFYEEHKKFLTYEDGIDYKLKRNKEEYLGYGRWLEYCNQFRFKK